MYTVAIEHMKRCTRALLIRKIHSKTTTGFLNSKIIKELGIPDHLTCLLRNLFAGQEATELDRTTDWLQIGKGVCQGYILTPCLFNLYAEYIMRNSGLDDKLESNCWEKYQ